MSYSSDNNYDHDTNYNRTKSGNNVSDTTQHCTNIPSTIYRDYYCNNILSDMNQDIILNLECDNNGYALRGRTSNESTFTANDTLNHISDTQHCDYMHNSTEYTTGTTSINTVETYDNGDDTITTKDGERISIMIPTSINSTTCTDAVSLLSTIDNHLNLSDMCIHYAVMTGSN
eukprot:775323_1